MKQRPSDDQPANRKEELVESAVVRLAQCCSKQEAKLFRPSLVALPLDQLEMLARYTERQIQDLIPMLRSLLRSALKSKSADADESATTMSAA